MDAGMAPGGMWDASPHQHENLRFYIVDLYDVCPFAHMNITLH